MDNMCKAWFFLLLLAQIVDAQLSTLHISVFRSSGSNFHFSNRNVNPIIFGIWDGKNSLFITQGTLIFPHSWPSSCGKVKIPHSQLRCSWEIFVSPRLLSYSWGNINVPFVIHREFLIIPSQILKMIGLVHSIVHQLRWQYCCYVKEE